MKTIRHPKLSLKFYILTASFILPIIIMLVSMSINGFYPFGNKSMLAIDFNQQFVDYYIFLKNTVVKGEFGNFFYSFSKSIGGNMIGDWSYYLMSPLNIIYIIMPIKWMNLSIVIVTLLRYGLTSFTLAYYLIKRQDALRTNPFITISLSIAYGLCGFSVSYQMVPILMDALWLLPLVLIGLEEYLDGRSPFMYIILLSMTIIVQYYMAYMICIFIIIYSLYYIHKDSEFIFNLSFIGEVLNKLLKLAIVSIIAVGITSFLLLPNILQLFESKGAIGGSLNFDLKFQIDPFDIISKFMIGAFDNSSWAAGPNLPNIYIGSFALVGSILFFISDMIKPKEKKLASGVIFIFFISVIHEFTSKLWHLGQNPAGFFYRFSWLISFFLILIAFKGMKRVILKPDFVLTGAIIAFIAQAVLLTREFSFLNVNQKQASLLLFIGCFFVLKYVKSESWKYLILTFLTILELGANVTIIQSRLNFSNAYTFDNALEVIEDGINKVRPKGNDFYRISKTFYRSMNDPLTFNYPGLTNFSSGLDVSTRQLFENLGNVAVDAKTYYYGTPLTDAIFGVKYFLDPVTFQIDDQMVKDKTYIFSTDVHRPDIINDQQFVRQTQRFDIYKTKSYLPIAFAVDERLISLELLRNEPIINQEKIAETLSKSNQSITNKVAVKSFEVEGISIREDDEKRRFFKREKKEPGIIRIMFEANAQDLYYLRVPRQMNSINSDIIIHLNGEKLPYRSKFGNDQLINLVSNSEKTDNVIEIIVDREDEVDLTNIELISFDSQKIYAMFEEKLKEGLQIKHWNSRSLEGNIVVNEDNNWVFTSIPFDRGWEISVDNKKMKPIEIWDSLLAFQITPGNHNVSLKFTPLGFRLGSIITLLFLFMFCTVIYHCEISTKETNIKKILKNTLYFNDSEVEN